MCVDYILAEGVVNTGLGVAVRIAGKRRVLVILSIYKQLCNIYYVHS